MADVLLMEASLGPEATRSTRVLATIITWTLSAFKTRGVHIDPTFKLDVGAIKRVSKVVCVYSTRPLVHSAAALLELLSRLILLLIFLALSCAPARRRFVVGRVRGTLEMHVNSVRRCAAARAAAMAAPDPQPSLPPRVCPTFHIVQSRPRSPPAPRAASLPNARARLHTRAAGATMGGVCGPPE